MILFKRIILFEHNTIIFFSIGKISISISYDNYKTDIRFGAGINFSRPYWEPNVLNIFYLDLLFLHFGITYHYK